MFPCSFLFPCGRFALCCRHLARAVELCVRFNDQRLGLYLAFDFSCRTQRQGLAVDDLAVQRTHYLCVLAGYGALDQTFLAYYYLACAVPMILLPDVIALYIVPDCCVGFAIFVLNRLNITVFTHFCACKFTKTF